MPFANGKLTAALVFQATPAKRYAPKYQGVLQNDKVSQTKTCFRLELHHVAATRAFYATNSDAQARTSPRTNSALKDNFITADNKT